MAIRHSEAPAEPWAGFHAKDDGDEPLGRSGHHHPSCARYGSAGLVALCLALPHVRTHLPAPAPNDRTETSPLRAMERIPAGIAGPYKPLPNRDASASV